MRETGPVRVRRGGDDSRVSSYLGFARTLLGEVKLRARNGNLDVLYNSITLPDGTLISVGTVHGQDIIEIFPTGGEEVDLTTYGFHCRPADISGQKTKTNIKRNKKGNWSKVDYPTAEWGVVNWWGRGNRRRRPSLQWDGPVERYWSAFAGLGDYIYRKREKYCRSPTGNILGACIYTHTDGTKKVRAATFSGSTLYIYQRNDNKSLTTATNYPTDPEAWELLGSFVITDLESSANATNTLRHTPCVFWNASGTEAFWMLTLGTTTSPTYNVTCECYSTATSFLSSTRGCALARITVDGLSGPVTQVTQVQPSLDVTTTLITTQSEKSRDTISCPGGSLTITSDYTSDYRAAENSGEIILAADWLGDTPTYVTAVGSGIDSAFTEINLDRNVSCSGGSSASASRIKATGRKVSISGTWGDFFVEPSNSFPSSLLQKVENSDYQSCTSTGTLSGCRLDLITGCSSYATNGEGRSSSIRVRFADLRTGLLITDRSEQATVVSGGQYWVETRNSVELWRGTKTELYLRVTSTAPATYSPGIISGTSCFGNSSSSSTSHITFSGLNLFTVCCGGFSYIKLNGAAGSPEKDVFASVTLSDAGTPASINYLTDGDPEVLCGLSTNPKFEIIGWVGD